MPTVRETVAEMVQYVFPQYAGAPGQIYGGRMMDWIATAGTLAASRVARGPVAVGAMDDIDFLRPVRVGEIAILRARVEYVGRTSLEVGVRVYAEDAASGRREVTLSSHLAFVAIDQAAHPRPIEARIVPADPGEVAVIEGARVRREARRARLASRAERAREVTDETEGFHWRFEQRRFVFPEDALHGSLMFAGRLLLTLDEAAGILAVRYARAPLVTASMDALEFYAPIRVGDILTYRGALTRVGTRSMEVERSSARGGAVRGRRPAHVHRVPDVRHAARRGGAAAGAARVGGAEPGQRDAADKRHAARVARVSALKESLALEPAW